MWISAAVAGVTQGRASKDSGVDDDVRGYFFGNFIIWQYAICCRLVIDCKMNDLE